MTVAACATTTAGAITVCGSILGMPWEALMLGSFTSTLVTIYAGKIDNKPKAIAAVALSTLAAGLGGPAIGSYVAAHFAEFSSTARLIQNAAAFAIGLCGPTAIPLIFAVMKRRAEAI